jgi:hypothetical protein
MRNRSLGWTILASSTSLFGPGLRVSVVLIEKHATEVAQRADRPAVDLRRTQRKGPMKQLLWSFRPCRRLLSLLAFLLLASPGLVSAADFYVSPGGSPSGNGSASSPWDLRTALAHPPAVNAGDTIWLRGGTYLGTFQSRLNGTSGAPIKVRQYPGERATLDGANSNRVVVLTVGGSYTWYWGFEVMTSNSNRSSVGEGIGTAQDSFMTGAGLKFINLTVHDTANGFGFWKEAIGAEIYGCLIYYNGRILPDGPPGHGIYVQNLTGTKRIVDNIIFGSLHHGIHAFGSEDAPLDNLHIEGNTVFNNGPLNDYQGNLLVGGGRVAHNLTLLNNSLFYPSTAGLNLNVGYDPYGNGVANAAISGNYIVHGDAKFSPLNTNVTMSGNFFYSTLYGTITSQFPANTYATSRPTGLRVTVRPNQYEPGRAHITVHNWNGASSVPVNLASVLPSGALYEIRNAQNFFGPPVASGTYSGGNVNLPMTGLGTAPAVGFQAPPPTGALFNVFVVLSTPAPR